MTNKWITDPEIMELTDAQMYVLGHTAFVQKIKGMYESPFADSSKMPTEQIMDDPHLLNKFLVSKSKDNKKTSAGGMSLSEYHKRFPKK